MANQQEQLLRSRNAELETELALRNRELVIEAALERVRIKALAMTDPADMLDICRIICEQLQALGVREIRNVQTAVIYESKGIYINYEYYRLADKTIITDVDYSHPLQTAFINQMLKDPEAFFSLSVEGKELKDWYKYQQTTNQFVDTHIAKAASLNYYWFSLRPVALGISTYTPLTAEDLEVFKRFRNVFELAYRRYADIEIAIAQAKEAKIEAALEKVRGRSLAMHQTTELQEIVGVVLEKLKELGIAGDEWDTASIIILIEGSKDVTQWIADQNQAYPFCFNVPSFDHPINTDVHTAWEKGLDYFSRIYTKEEKNSFFKWNFEHSDFKYLPDEAKQRVLTFENFAFSSAWGKYTGIGVASYSGKLPSENDANILKRFNKVFEQAYVRFLDLQKAEAQAREAKIEASLERVRAKAMAMHSSEDLSQTVNVFFKELKALGITPIRCGVGQIDEETRTTSLTTTTSLRQGDSFDVIGKLKQTGHPVLDGIFDHWKLQEEYHPVLIGSDITAYYNVTKSQIAYPDYSEEVTQYGNNFFFKEGFVFAWTEKELSEDELKIFRRFTSVLSLTYRRYIDLKEAEAQIREAQIEAALEKVRSRSLAMHHTQELQEVITVVFEKLKELNVVMDVVNISIPSHATKGVDFWIAGPDNLYSTSIYVPYFDTPVVTDFWAAQEAGPGFFTKAYTFEEKTAYWTWAFVHSGFKYMPQERKELILAGKGFAVSSAFEKNTAIVVSSHAGEMLSEKEIDIVARFARVFEQAYVRFLDLQKAEAQAKEAQIETALEKVRSRSIGMQKSDELKAVIQVIYEQFGHLNIGIEHAGFVVDYKPGGDWHFWVADKVGSPSDITVANFDSAWNTDFNDAKKRGIDFFAINLTFEEKNKFYRDLFEHAAGEMPEQTKELIFSKPGLAVSTVVLADVGLYIENFSGTPYTDEENATLMRFGKVFQQTYTRFLDLQKAEAQAREARIEASLERVRSRAMAMHKTDELMDAAELLFKELTGLGISSMAVTYALMDAVEKNALYYSINPVDGKVNPMPLALPHTETEVMRSILASWKKKETSYLVELDEKATLQHQTYIGEFILAGFKKHNIPFSVEAFLEVSPKKAVIHTFNFTQGYIFIIGGARLTGAQEEIVLRFTKVFELTYRRFLDLKQAEEQARESQIQLALERVRARTMAMQHSDELSETVFILFQQFKELGENPDQATIGIVNEDEHVIEYWVTMHGSQTNRVFKFSIDEPDVTLKIYKGWKEQKKSIVIDLAGKPLHDFTAYRAKMGGAPAKKGEKRRIINVAFFSKGLINVQSNEERSGQSLQLLERFAAVFDSTYRRFLDLQHAEAQAREAQIQLALERVRARTMAMQKSDELTETSYVLFQQFKELGADAEQISIGIFNEEEGIVEVSGTLRGVQFPQTFRAVIDEPFVMGNVYDGWKSGKKSLVIEMAGKKLHEYNLYRNKLSGLQFNVTEESPSDRYVVNCAYFSKGVLSSSASDNPSPQTIQLLARFAAVFDGTYTRFLDLKQAEAQARESQIQLALERVRARTMAMQKSDELLETSSLLFKQFYDLGASAEQISIGIVNEAENVVELSATIKGTAWAQSVKVPIDDPFMMSKAYTAWKAKKESLTIIIEGKELLEYNMLRNKMGGGKFYRTEGISDARWIINVAFFSKGMLACSTYQPIPAETAQLLERFAAVFDGTYTRFLDLKQAEAQAREARIEAALERVRSKTMAMHNSADIGETVSVMFEQLVNLGVKTSVRCGVAILYDNKHMEVWTASSDDDGKVSLILGRLDMTIHPMLEKMHEAWQNKDLSFSYELAGNDIKNYYKAIIASPDYHFQHTVESMPERQINNVFFFPEGALFAFTTEPFSAEATQLFKRFAGVFGQTYRRFLDLQTAEAQAKESKIEAGLERLRSKTMAMHNSRDVGETVAAMFDECTKLGVDKSVRCGVGIISKTKEMEVWTAYADADEKIDFIVGRLDMTSHQMLNGVFNHWQNKELHSSYTLAGEDQKDYYRAINASHDYDAHFKLGSLPAQQFQNGFYFKDGFIYVFSQEPLSADAVAIFKRFAGVFGLTYRRFLDLQKAEAQAREGKIETSLERVRSRTMAMQQSTELSDTSVEVFKQLIGLGIAPNRLFIGIIKDDSGDIELWATDEDGGKISSRFTGNKNRNLSVKKMYDGWKQQRSSLIIDMKGAELKNYFHYLSHELHVPFKLGLSQKRRVQLIAYFSQGFIGMASSDLQPPETTVLLERFAGVFNLTYTRFNDLQKAEAQAKEAIKQASVDRVRAEIASMRTTKDLERITPLVWNELTTLGVPFIRCGVFIVDEPEELVHYYLSTPDGDALAAFQLHFDAEGIGRNVLQNWREKHVFTIHWSEAEFTEYTKSLVRQGAVGSGEDYVTAHPPTSLDLHFFPFLQGMLYVGNIVPLSADEMLLVQSLADAFSTAYARYEDFNKLEEAKREVENTLTALKAAQTKLIQSEKMASLGELTAGIAHEIQNPLNFVNNFSEVNQEMIDELEEELRAGNIEDALAIAADIKQNEEKINHHGKRADGIVKGMLQHSRTGGGEKQPTNMNMLADEFLRLSYHGLRAKDKTFNAEMVTHFDPDLPKINVIPQDMGRVMLNLFNNAFYAVNQKKKLADSAYKPEVTVTTTLTDEYMVIKVRDNGTGIPDAIKEKIMQPFFTTKPTGEGTGLGLSLTYDMVVKGHGGMITVNTKEGEFTEFVVQLPV